MECFLDIPNLVGFMVHCGFHRDPLYKSSIQALNGGELTAWEFVCQCQYIVDRETIKKLEERVH